MSQLVWYRNDLRTHHQGLSEALASGEPVVALYLVCPRQWDQHQVAPARRWYVLESLRELGRNLAALGVPLFVREAGAFRDCAGVIEAFVRDNRIRRVSFTREYPLNERRRDEQVLDRLARLGVAARVRDESVLMAPDALFTGKGTPYNVFTPYGRVWRQRLEQAPPQRPVSPPTGTGVTFRDDPVIDALAAALDVPASLRAHWQPGERAARRALHDFTGTALRHYHSHRDLPAEPGTSGLSAALSTGTLAPAEAWWCAMEASADPAFREGATVWLNELAWRDFYRQIIRHYPALSRGHAFRPEEPHIPWRWNEDHWHAWCEGRTGYPLVDAGMRQLRETGWMHNRLRMVVAMFLSKQLFIDWRHGERFFMQHLVDGDFAANNGGWQWSASVGTDAAPYFRVFNPVRQGRRFDPRGRFIARYVPELADLDDDSIHQPWKQPLLAGDYPAPVVPLEGVRDAVTRAFRMAREEIS